MKDKKNADYTLYLITDRGLTKNREFLQCVREAIIGGVTIVQLREKNISTRDFFQLGLKIKEVTREYQVPLIINDRLDVALALEADGVHLGQDDLPAQAARKILGPHRILGVSINNLQEALLAEKEGADYVGAGAVFPTSTKNDVRTLDYPELVGIKKEIKIPVVAIGGINETNLQMLKESGINGICVASAILGKENIKEAAQNLKHLWN